MKIAVIGAGVSGLTCAQYLKDKASVTVFERESKPGGLIRCDRVGGSLFHICGGHVFNSKRTDVLEWFWNHFDREREFVLADRNSVVRMPDGKQIPYPIENHMYMFGPDIQRSFIRDMCHIASSPHSDSADFESFLLNRFGRTLYELYFRPYNEKVWRRDLKKVPIDWLEGKLPMPTVVEIIYNNFNHIEEKEFVHSRFWYERSGGSQFIADRLAEGIDVRYNSGIKDIRFGKDGGVMVNGEEFDLGIFCGNIKELFEILQYEGVSDFRERINSLEYHGTTSVFCEIDKNPYSWIYQPDTSHESHRIICTGNFAETNNAPGTFTSSVEFTDEISKDAIPENLSHIPYHPRYITHHYSRYTYPIQDKDTRSMIREVKLRLAHKKFYLTGRFADWEYYNMDAAMGAALDLCGEITKDWR